NIGEDEEEQVEIEVFMDDELYGFNDEVELTSDVSDPDSDMISCELWTNASGIWELLNSYIFYNGSGIISGTSSDMISPLTTYSWMVKCTDDGINWVTAEYWFITGEDTPLILDASPDHGIVTTYNPRLSVNVLDYQDDFLTVTFRQIVGDTWVTLGIYSGYSGLFTHNTVNMNVTGETYVWSFNVTDGKNNWVNVTRSFQVQPFVLKWVNNENPINTLGPVVDDVDNDGDYEIIQVGTGKATCYNGSTGEIIWQYYHQYLHYHSVPAIADLNNDGFKEIVMSCHFETAGAQSVHTIALHANNGSLYWDVRVPSDDRHFVIADIDGTGYPYVFVTSHVDLGYVSKLWGTNGTVQYRTRVYYPCHGGLSIGDLDNDGSFELILADYNGAPGKGMHCYDADTLEFKWYNPRRRADPQIGVLADVNKDGILDVITSTYNNGPVQVIDGATGVHMSGYDGLTWATHSPNTVYDIDGDGNLEMLVCRTEGTSVRVFDLYTKSVDATLPEIAGEPPFMADVIGDEKLEIISTNQGSITIYNNNYQSIQTIIPGANRWTMVQDVDNDGQNELIVTRGSRGEIRVYDTSAYTPIPHVRTGMYGYSEKSTGAGVYTPPPGPPQPILKEESPKNGALDVLINPTLSIHAVEYQVHEMMYNRIVDYQYDKMDITVSWSTNPDGPWTYLISFNNTGNGVYTIPTTTMNQPDTTYYWNVTAVDINPAAGGITTTKIYHFTTQSAPDIETVNISTLTPYQGEDVTFSATITDDVHVDETKLLITGPAGYSPLNKTLYDYEWTQLAYDDFESGWGNYADGGADCSRATETPNILNYPLVLVHQGVWAANIQANSGAASSFSLTTPIDIATPGYDAVTVDFWMNAYGMGYGGKYYLEYYDGSNWVIRKTYEQNSGSFAPSVYTNTYYKFANWKFFHDTVWINKSDYNLPDNFNIRFRCGSGNSNNDVYLDQIYINATYLEPVDDLYSSVETFNLIGQYQYSFWCKDINGNTNTSPVYAFTVANAPPTILNELPTNNAENMGLNPVLQADITDLAND
ncbi:MAG: VCBS repeat-containing protein, partial [Candidatus Thermoplasmatota archaeon]|nr:VCBS repeat-containing protein [Candidatus Thermoplasmatota archaeon]